jgi:hypothetical protein
VFQLESKSRPRAIAWVAFCERKRAAFVADAVLEAAILASLETIRHALACREASPVSAALANF